MRSVWMATRVSLDLRGMVGKRWAHSWHATNTSNFPFIFVPLPTPPASFLFDSRKPICRLTGCGIGQRVASSCLSATSATAICVGMICSWHFAKSLPLQCWTVNCLHSGSRWWNIFAPQVYTAGRILYDHDCHEWRDPLFIHQLILNRFCLPLHLKPTLPFVFSHSLQSRRYVLRVKTSQATFFWSRKTLTSTFSSFGWAAANICMNKSFSCCRTLRKSVCLVFHNSCMM